MTDTEVDKTRNKVVIGSDHQVSSDFAFIQIFIVQENVDCELPRDQKIIDNPQRNDEVIS